ncbi:MAG: TraM recognition domain-containing protein [Alphaproteobacteria bacterium]|nr:TraM recognition domain-containing protein [Alphaproteobacteria bacterium]NKC02285.1 TraM recognition domain-containing protein [Pseudomonadales bacterium]
MHDIPRGVTSRYLREQRVPRGFFQDPERILTRDDLHYDPANPGAKILVGALGAYMIGIEDNRHLLTVAGNRSGKSVTVINNLYFYLGSVLCTDPKAELATKTAHIRHKRGQKVFVLDPFKRARGKAVRFRARYNPLARLKPDNPYPVEDAMLIVDALVVRSGEEKDPHWNEAAGQFLLGLILYVAYTPDIDPKDRTLVTVRKLIMRALDTSGERYTVPTMIFAAGRKIEKSGLNDVADAIAGSITGFYDKSATERAGVLSSLNRHTQFIDYGAMKEVLRGHDFDLEDLKREKVSVYLCLPATRMGMCNRWLRLFVNQLLQAMETEETVPPAPVLVCLDEFPVLGFMSQLQDAAGQIASFHVKLWIILQDWGQGKALYKDRFESFAANAGILQAFGNVDLTTTEYLSKRLDKTAVETTRTGETAAEQVQKGLKGENNSIELFDLMRPDEISRFFARNDNHKRQLILWAGKAPMILQRVEYYDAEGPFHHYFKDATA